MRYDIATIREWMARFRLDDPLLPNDPRYLDLENFTFEDQTYRLRGTDWVEPLFHCIQFSNHPTCQLFSGYKGTGKSTELLRLKKRLEDAGYAVILSDGAAFHDLEHPLTIEDMMIILAAATDEGAAQLLGDTGGTSYWDRFKDFLTREIDLKDVSISLKPLNLKMSVRSSSSLWLQVRQRLESSLGVLKDHVHGSISANVARIRKETGKEVVFILDSLEKLGGTEITFGEIMRSVVRTFSQFHQHLRLPGCHSIYTIPPYTGLIVGNIDELYDGGVTKPLPAVKVREKDGTPYEPGLAALETLLDKRVGVQTLFGKDHVSLQRLLLSSGGHVRGLIKMVREIIMRNGHQEFPPTQDLVISVIRDFSEQAAQAVRPEGIPLLEAIRKTNSLEHVEEGMLHLLARYVDHHLVLCYQNGEGWYQLHELIKDNVARRARDSGGTR